MSGSGHPLGWADVLAIFLRAAFLSINGSTTLALLEQDLVRRYHLLTPAQFATGVVVGSASPGPMGYGCIALGFLADGWRGALVATFTSWLPAFLVIPLRVWHRRLEGRAWLAGFTWGVGAAGAGLLAAMVAGLTVQAVTGWIQAGIGLMVLALLFRGLPPAAVLLTAAVAGALFLR